MPQLHTQVSAALALLDKAHANCTEPSLLKLVFKMPDGQDKVIATVSTQPPPAKRQRRDIYGELLGGYNGHLLFKRPETGAVTHIRLLLESDKELLGAVQAVHGKSKAGACITNVVFLAESLCDKAWGSLSPEEKQPWKEAAELAKGYLKVVAWRPLVGAIDRCHGFSRFVDTLKALKPAPRAAPPPYARDDLDDL
jgi:hypothetical protein